MTKRGFRPKVVPRKAHTKYERYLEERVEELEKLLAEGEKKWDKSSENNKKLREELKKYKDWFGNLPSKKEREHQNLMKRLDRVKATHGNP